MGWSVTLTTPLSDWGLYSMKKVLTNPYKSSLIPPENGLFYLHLANLNTYPQYHGEYDDLPQDILCEMNRTNPKFTRATFYDPKGFEHAPMYPISVLTLIIHHLYKLGAECIGENEFKIKTPDDGYFNISIDKGSVDKDGCNFVISFLISSLHPFTKIALGMNDLECEITVGFAYTPMQFLFDSDASQIMNYLQKGEPYVN